MLYSEGELIFTTAFYMVLNIETGVITAVSAGHPAPFLVRNDDESAITLKELKQYVISPALALLENYDYKSFSIQLKSGDTLILYTDGIYEVVGASNQEFGSERMAISLNKNRNNSIKEMFNGLIDDALEFSFENRFNDDVCLIGFTYNQP